MNHVKPGDRVWCRAAEGGYHAIYNALSTQPEYEFMVVGKKSNDDASPYPLILKVPSIIQIGWTMGELGTSQANGIISGYNISRQYLLNADDRFIGCYFKHIRRWRCGECH